MSTRCRHPHVVRWWCRAYSLLIWVYPSSLRREYRHELILTFRNQAEDALNAGSLSSAASFVVCIAADWLHTLWLGVRAEDSAALSMLGLGSDEHEAGGCLDRSVFTTSLMLATLGVALLIGGWYWWLHFNAAILSAHRAL